MAFWWIVVQFDPRDTLFVSEAPNSVNYYNGHFIWSKMQMVYTFVVQRQPSGAPKANASKENKEAAYDAWLFHGIELCELLQPTPFLIWTLNSFYFCDAKTS